jgi:hypothetical protein
MPALHLDQKPCADEVHALRCKPEQGWLPLGSRAGDGSCDPTYADRQRTDNPQFRLQLRIDARDAANFSTTLNKLEVDGLRCGSAADHARQKNEELRELMLL